MCDTQGAVGIGVVSERVTERDTGCTVDSVEPGELRGGAAARPVGRRGCVAGCLPLRGQGRPRAATAVLRVCPPRRGPPTVGTKTDKSENKIMS